jgi:hypothetical protein
MNSKAIFCLSLLVLAAVVPALGRDDEDSEHTESSGERGTYVCWISIASLSGAYVVCLSISESQFERSGNEIKVQSEGKTGNQKDKFELKAHFEGSAMQLEMRQFTRIADTASGFRFRVRPHSVVEYVEQDGVDGLSAGDNTNCTSVLLRGVSFSASNWRTSTIGNATVSVRSHCFASPLSLSPLPSASSLFSV